MYSKIVPVLTGHLDTHSRAWATFSLVLVSTTQANVLALRVHSDARREKCWKAGAPSGVPVLGGGAREALSFEEGKQSRCRSRGGFALVRSQKEDRL